MTPTSFIAEQDGETWTRKFNGHDLQRGCQRTIFMNQRPNAPPYYCKMSALPMAKCIMGGTGRPLAKALPELFMNENPEVPAVDPSTGQPIAPSCFVRHYDGQVVP